MHHSPARRSAMQYDIPVLRIHLKGRQRLAADDLPGDGILHLFADDTPQIAGAELAALRLFTQQGKRGFCPAQTDAFCRERFLVLAKHQSGDPLQALRRERRKSDDS